MEQKQNRGNIFTRFILVIITGFIATMIGYKYFFVSPKADISGGLITLIIFLIVLALSEMFDTFSVGEIFKLSREVKEKEKEVEKKDKEIVKSETERRELLSQLINLSTNVSQRQSNTNIYGVPHDALQVSVKPAEPKEAEESKQKEEQEARQESETETPSNALPNQEQGTTLPRRRAINSGQVVELALRKFMADNGIDFSKVYKEMKIQSFLGVDPISDRSPIFDAYLNEIDREVFFEVIPRLNMSSMYFERMYLMISKVYHYKLLKKNNSYLQLILVKLPDTRSSSVSRMFDYFQPAINNSLLRINIVEFTAEEESLLYEE